MKKKHPGFKEYVVGLQIPPGAIQARSLHIAARGFSFAVEKCPDLNRIRSRSRRASRIPDALLPHEVLIRAKSREHAQSVATLLHASEAVALGSLFMGWFLGLSAHAAPIAVPRRITELEGLDRDLAFNALRSIHLSDRVPNALVLAAHASRRRHWQYAIYKLLDSYIHLSVEDAVLHPEMYHYDPLTASRNARDHVYFSAAITTAYAAIEELDLTVRAIAVSPNNVRAKNDDGSWVPRVLDDLQSRLRRAHVEDGECVYWHRRGSLRRHEKVKQVATHSRAPSARGLIRDAYVSIPDALDHARWLRNKVTGHRIDSRARSLTPYDVANVQGLARTLISTLR